MMLQQKKVMRIYVLEMMLQKIIIIITRIHIVEMMLQKRNIIIIIARIHILEMMLAFWKMMFQKKNNNNEDSHF